MSLNDKLSIAILPIDITDGDKQANLQAVKDGVALIADGIDLIILPELFSTGFTNDAAEVASLAETVDGETMSAIRSLAASKMAAICGSFIAKDGDSLYNRGFIVEPNGETTYYDKRHLFCLSDESKIFVKGNRLPPVIRFRGWNICLAICYDLRFPIWLRNSLNKYDLLVLPSNWPDSRAYAWTHLLQARAIENISYVIGANRSGEDRYGVYDGNSFVYDYLGKPIGKEGKNKVVYATLDRATLRSQRKRFPIWCDADDFKCIL